MHGPVLGPSEGTQVLLSWSLCASLLSVADVLCWVMSLYLWYVKSGEVMSIHVGVCMYICVCISVHMYLYVPK